MGDVPAMSAAFAPASPVLRALCETSQPLTQYDIDMLPQFRAMDAHERQWQWALDVEVYVPIHSRRTLIGALALGAKPAGEPYSAQDLVVLSALAGQTAVALENARLFDDQKRLNQQVSLLNQELIAANAQLERIDRAKTDFLNIASHELRTPLTQVRGYADLLGEMMAEGTIDPSNAQKMVASIRQATERLEGIYSAMLDASAIGVDGLQLHLEPVRPAFFIEQALSKWQDALQQRQQTLVTTGIGELPALEGDQERLTQAFSNLINNAIKFTPDAGAIEVRGCVVEGAEPAVELVVADTGVGIDPQDHDLIFEKFHRVGSADLHSTDDIRFKAGGPGLGLTIAKGIIEGHGGRIWVESERYDEELLPGSRFHVLLPIRSTRAHAPAESEPTKKPRPIAELARRLASRVEPKGNQELR
jgi:signal transduction histidine kinase